MPRKKGKYRPREDKFLQAYIEHGNLTQAYIDAGYAVSNRNTAHAAASRLLRRLDSTADYREIFEQIGLTERKIAERGKELLFSKDEQVAARTFAVLTKCTGWQREVLGLEEGAEIVIMARKPSSEEKPTGSEAPEKPPIIPISQGILK